MVRQIELKRGKKIDNPLKEGVGMESYGIS